MFDGHGWEFLVLIGLIVMKRGSVTHRRVGIEEVSIGQDLNSGYCGFSAFFIAPFSGGQ